MEFLYNQCLELRQRRTLIESQNRKVKVAAGLKGSTRHFPKQFKLLFFFTKYTGRMNLEFVVWDDAIFWNIFGRFDFDNNILYFLNAK